MSLAILTTIMLSCTVDSEKETSTEFQQKNGNPTLEDLSLDGDVGIVQNGKYEITINTSALKDHWENMLANDTITATLTNFEIIEVEDSSNQQSGYLLNAISTDGKVQIAIPLLYNSTHQTFAVEPASGSLLSPITYTCRGCNTCRLKIDRFPSGRLIQVNCKPGCVPPTKCEKTESVTL